jgi:hypothetical protein
MSENSDATTSCGFSKIVTQQTAESFPTMERAFRGKLVKLRPDYFVFQPLMVSLGVRRIRRKRETDFGRSRESRPTGRFRQKCVSFVLFHEPSLTLPLMFVGAGQFDCCVVRRWVAAGQRLESVLTERRTIPNNVNHHSSYGPTRGQIVSSPDQSEAAATIRASTEAALPGVVSVAAA